MNGEQIIDIPFPLAGVEEYRALTRGRAFNGRTSAPTTQSAMNVRGIDPVSGRARGAVRPGFSKFYASQINGAESIQEITTIVNATEADYGFVGQIASVIETDPAGSDTDNGTLLITSAGAQQFSAAGLSDDDVMGPSCWDDNGNAYTLYLHVPSTAFKVVRRAGSTYVEAWTTTAFSASTSSATSQTYIPLGLAVKSSLLDADGNVTTAGTVYAYVRTSGSNNHELWRFNAETGANLDSGAAWKHSNGGGISGLSQPSVGASNIDNCAAYSDGYVGLLEITNGQDLYARIIDSTTGSSTQSQLLGPGSGTSSSYAVNMIGDSEGNFFWSGYQRGESTTRVGKVTSTGTVTSATGLLMAAYSPVAKQLYALNATSQIVWLSDSLTSLRDPVSVTGGSYTHIYATPTGGVVVSKLVAPRSAEIRMCDANGALVDWSVVNPSSQFTSIKFRFLAVNQRLPNSADSLAYYRTASQLVVAGGTVHRIKNGVLSTVTRGTQALKRSASVIFSAQVDDRIYFADGQTAQYYNCTTNTMADWTATGSGVPIDSSGGRPTLICAWRRRIVTSGLRQDANSIFMSAQGNPADHDYSPEDLLATSAFTQSLQDVVNAIVPYSDDRLIVGCDHSILQYSGDPQDGGSVDVISDTIGFAWGRPFCRSANGTLYFVGSRGGVYRMVPDQIPESISSESINERLAEIDYSTHIIRMAWDDRQQGFYMTVSPLDATASATHYWYDARNNAWWLDQFASESHNPLAVHVIDGASPDDRLVVFGGRDGYVRQVDLSADTDDDQPIASYVFMGPIDNTLLIELQVTLSGDSGDVVLSAHGNDSAERALASTARWTGQFSAGNNLSRYPRHYAAVQYLKLAATGYWSLEQITARVSLGTAGRLRRYNGTAN